MAEFEILSTSIFVHNYGINVYGDGYIDVHIALTSNFIGCVLALNMIPVA